MGRQISGEGVLERSEVVSFRRLGAEPVLIFPETIPYSPIRLDICAWLYGRPRVHSDQGRSSSSIRAAMSSCR